MREVNIRLLRENIAKEMGDLPLLVTKNGVPIAEIRVPENTGVSLSVADVYTPKQDVPFNPQPKAKTSEGRKGK